VIISRYISREILNALTLVMVILLFAFLSQQIVRYLNFVAIGKIPTNVLVQLISFEVPFLFALLLPLGLYLGALLALGRFYADNEMIVMQMSGYGERRIFTLIMRLGLIVSSFVFILMLFVNPLVSVKQKQLMKSDEATLHLIQTLIPGRCQASPDGRHVMYVEKLSRDHKRAENVFLAQEKKSDNNEEGRKSWMLILADQGYQIKDPQYQIPYFVTADGFRYEGAPGQNDFKITQFKKYAVHLPEPEIHSLRHDTETLSTTELWNTYNDPKHAAELQWRVSIGIATFLLAILAVPFSILQPRKGRYFILLPAILIYIVYMEGLSIARRFVEQNDIPSLIGLWGVHLLMIIFIIVCTRLRAKYKRV
jgi:lipopolysaccharide export system permease protein